MVRRFVLAASILIVVGVGTWALFSLGGNASIARASTVDFSALLGDDGAVTASYRIFFPELGYYAAGRITCFAIVDASAAWVAGWGAWCAAWARATSRR